MNLFFYMALGGYDFDEPVDYMAWAFMILMRGKDITQAIGRVGLKVEPVLGPDWFFYANENR